MLERELTLRQLITFLLILALNNFENAVHTVGSGLSGQPVTVKWPTASR